MPDSFSTSFPGVGSWISSDGPFNEHLIGDVGAMYLALGAASLAGVFLRARAVLGVLGTAWTVFGVLHLAYHLTHLDRVATAADAVGAVVSLSVSLLLGVLLVVASVPRWAVGR